MRVGINLFSFAWLLFVLLVHGPEDLFSAPLSDGFYGESTNTAARTTNIVRLPDGTERTVFLGQYTNVGAKAISYYSLAPQERSFYVQIDCSVGKDDSTRNIDFAVAFGKLFFGVGRTIVPEGAGWRQNVVITFFCRDRDEARKTARALGVALGVAARQVQESTAESINDRKGRSGARSPRGSDSEFRYRHRPEWTRPEVTGTR